MSSPQSYDEFLLLHQSARDSVSVIRFALIFGVSFFLLQWGYQGLDGTAAYSFYIEHLVVQPSAALIHFIAPQNEITAQGHRLAWSGGGLNILNGCDGADAIELLLAAFIAAAGGWRMKVSGVLLGLGIIYLLNQARIVALYFALQHNKALFESIHGLAGPLVIIAVVTLFFAWWIAPRDPQAAT